MSKAVMRLDPGKAQRVGMRAIHSVPNRAEPESAEPERPTEPLLATPAGPAADFGSIVTEAAHDLNTTLGSIRLHLDLLELESSNPERARQRLMEIRPAVDHAAGIARLLQNSCGRAPDVLSTDPLPETDLNPVLRRMVPLISAMLPSHVDLQMRLSPKLKSVAIDPVDLVRIVSNLVLNAVAILRDVNHTKDRVTIETANGGSGSVQLRILDTGPGISDDIKAGVLQPFFAVPGKLERPALRPGLGLSSVLRLVRRTRGTIQFASAPETGTEVTILWPASGSLKKKQPRSRNTVPAGNSTGTHAAKSEPNTRQRSAKK